MKKLLVGQNISEKCKKAITEMGCEPVLLSPFSRLGKGVSTHADMLVFKGKNGLFVHRDYYNENKMIFDSLGVKVIKTDENIREDYPNDILFNAVASGDTLFSNTDHTSELIKSEYKRCVKVKQGYTGCSTCKITDRAFITADDGLYKAYRENGIDALLIEEGHIDLPFYNYGFIGGASVTIGNTVCFFGRIESHPSYEKIVSFAEKYGVSVKSLSDEKLLDLGSAVLLN